VGGMVWVILFIVDLIFRLVQNLPADLDASSTPTWRYPMNFSIRSLAIAIGFVILPAVALGDTYHSASFSGQLAGGSANVRAPFSTSGGLSQGESFSGTFVYDDNLIPAPGSGFFNVFFSSFPDIAEIPPATAFTLTLGGFSFDLADADPGEAAIQYNNGNFNGFFYISDFMYLGSQYELSLQGGTLAIVPFVGGFPGFNSLVNGNVNIGNGNLTGISVFTPSSPVSPTPESSSVALWGVSLVGLVLWLGLRK
jgi:hypothetical protein